MRESSLLRLLRSELAEDVEQDAAVLVVLDLLRSVDADNCGELLRAAVCGFRFHFELAAIFEFGFQQIGEASEVVDFFTGEAE